MKIILFSLLFTFAPLGIAEPLPQGHPTIQQGIDSTAQEQGEVHEGIVLSTIPTKHYTYIEVQQGDEKSWLATAKMTLSDGATIRYGNSVPMMNFYSSSLKREFPKLFFVGSIEVVKEP